MVVLYVCIVIAILLVMITIHEFGHYIVGRLLGFKINEFAIGFGKAIWQKTNKRGEKISLRIFPLGGYCAFYGEDGIEEETDENGNVLKDENGKPIKKDAKSDPDIFTNKPVWKRILVFLAGVTFNFVSAIIFSFILLVSTGYGNVYIVKNINEDFITQYGASYIQENDKIVAINGEKISYVWNKTLNTLVSTEEGKEYTLTIQREGAEEPVVITVQSQTYTSYVYNSETGQYEKQLDEDENEVTYVGLGLNVALSSMPLSFVDALLECFSFTIGLVWMVLKSLWLLITFQLPISAIGGTGYTIVFMTETIQQNLTTILLFLPLLAANLAAFNLLPFPALDGCHILLAIIEAIRGKRLPENVESWIHFSGFIILIAFMIIVDLLHFI